MNDYPMLHVLVRWGHRFAAALALVIAAAGIWAAWSGANFLWALLGLGAGAICYGLLLSYVELVKLVMDMLLPK
jgi:heme A synthase